MLFCLELQKGKKTNRIKLKCLNNLQVNFFESKAIPNYQINLQMYGPARIGFFFFLISQPKPKIKISQPNKRQFNFFKVWLELRFHFTSLSCQYKQDKRLILFTHFFIYKESRVKVVAYHFKIFFISRLGLNS